jgi:hypothetical protein
MICNTPGRICYGSENSGLGSLHDDDVGFIASEVYHTVVTTIVEQTGWMTEGGWTK